jgi:hypothetical protein
METKNTHMQARRPSRRAWFSNGLIAAVLLLVIGAGFGVWMFRLPEPAVVETSVRSFVEGMAMSGKIVLVEARDKVVITETTPGYLFGDTSVGRFLGIRSDATIQATAWADISFVIDLLATKSWSIRYNPMEGGTLMVKAPPLSMLTPAIHTDTIEIITIDRSIFLDEKRLEGKVLAGLTARFIEASVEMTANPELRGKATASLEGLVRAFLVRGKVPVSRVDISFAALGE